MSSQANSSSDEAELVVRLSRLARRLQDEDDVDARLHAIVHAAIDMVPGARHAGISVVRGRRKIYTQAATADVARRVDQLQYDTGQGPCLEAIREQRTVRLSDMTVETRWLQFTRQAAQLGVLSMLSFQLFVQRDNLGALNLYAEHADAFDDKSEQVGLVFAAHAAVAMSDALQRQQLTTALGTRDLIGQAKGILMERYKLTSDQAFALLARASQESNTKLADVAHTVAETGNLIGR
jgi:transcriptional regulator with GAF, ATPase, and Fis domain